MLNDKQRAVLAESLIKIAEYILLTLIIGQVALKRIEISMFIYSVIMAAMIYLLSLFILRKFEEV